MANDLVRRNGSDSDGDGRAEPNALGHYADTDQDWDLPPEQTGYGWASTHPLHTARTEHAAQQADADVRRARAHGDHSFAALREEDAADLRQKRWDWGDLRTWLWIAGMCIGFLLIVALCYFLPYGRHASPPPIRVY